MGTAGTTRNGIGVTPELRGTYVSELIQVLTTTFGLNEPVALEGCWQAAAWHGRFDIARLVDVFSVDEAISSAGLRYPYLKMSQAGRDIAPPRYTRNSWAGTNAVPGFADVLAVKRLYDEGASVILNRMEEWCVPIAKIVHGIVAAYSGYVEVSAFATPPGSAALPCHRDCQDLLVLQLVGEKQWTIEESSPGELVQEGPTDSAGAQTDVTLRRGEVLYLPRGAAHAACATQAGSVHVTFGFNRFDKGAVVRTLHAVVADVVARQPFPLTDADDRAFQDDLLNNLHQALADRFRGRLLADEVLRSRSNSDPGIHIVGL